MTSKPSLAQSVTIYQKLVKLKELISVDEAAKAHLDQCVEHAMARYYQGERGGAVSCFLSGVGRHSGTNWIKGSSSVSSGTSVMSMLFKAYDEGKAAFERALRSFADKEVAPPVRTTIPVPRGSR